MGVRSSTFEFGEDKNIQCIVLGLWTRGMALRLKRITGYFQRNFGHKQNKPWIWVTNLEPPCQNTGSRDVPITTSMKTFIRPWNDSQAHSQASHHLTTHRRRLLAILSGGTSSVNGCSLSCVLGLALSPELTRPAPTDIWGWVTLHGGPYAM